MPIVTSAPLPRLRAFAALLRPGSGPDDVALARPWLSAEDDRPSWFSRAAFALRAIVEGHRGEDGMAPRLFLPDYFCNSATIPARAAGATPIFYPVDETLAPDWQAVEALARTAPPELFLQVHYFGRPAELAPARKFCDAHGAALIEDAAHCLAPGPAIGLSGDYVLWSLYKHVPAPDGGLLVARATPAARPGPVLAAAAAIATAAPNPWPWAAKRLLQRAAPALAARLRRTPSLPFDIDPEPPDAFKYAAISAAARRIIAALAEDLPRIAAARIAAERAVRNALAGANHLAPLLPISDGSWTPYRAMFRASGRAHARNWYGRFRAAGNAVETWPDLALELRRDPAHHRGAVILRNTVISLPLDAASTPEAIAAAYAVALAPVAAIARSRSRRPR